MDHMRDEIRIEAPVEHCWALLCDWSRRHDWQPRGEVSDWTGPFDQVGTTYVETMKMMGHEYKDTSRVVEVEPLKLIHEHTDQGPMDVYYRFERDGGATHVIVESDYEMPGQLPGFIKKVFSRGFIERSVRSQLEDFKAIAEASVAVPA